MFGNRINIALLAFLGGTTFTGIVWIVTADFFRPKSFSECMLSEMKNYDNASDQQLRVIAAACRDRFPRKKQSASDFLRRYEPEK